MGLFDVFKKKEPTEADWKQRYRKIQSGSSRNKEALSLEYFAALKMGIENSRYKVEPDGKEDPELRAECDGVPFRVKFNRYTGTMDIEMKCSPPGEGFELIWNPEVMEKGPTADEDWHDEDEEIRVSVGKDVFVETHNEYIEEALADLLSYPEEVIQKVIDHLQGGQLNWVTVKEDSITLDLLNPWYRMDLPITEVKQLVSFGAGLIKMLGGASIKKVEVGSTGTVKLVKCDYCRARFNLATRDNCPHCGAPCDG